MASFLEIPSEMTTVEVLTDFGKNNETLLAPVLTKNSEEPLDEIIGSVPSWNYDGRTYYEQRWGEWKKVVRATEFSDEAIFRAIIPQGSPYESRCLTNKAGSKSYEVHASKEEAFLAARGIVAIVSRARCEQIQPPMPRNLPEEASRPYGGERKIEWRSKPEEQGILPVIFNIQVSYTDFVEALAARPDATFSYYQRA